MRIVIIIVNLILLFFVPQGITFSQVDFWQQTQGGPYGSSMYISLLWNRNGYLFAGTISNGGYRSRDSGKHWMKINAQGGVDFLGADSNGTIYANIGKSSDNGTTWQSIPVGATVNCLSVDSNNNIYAGTTDGVYLNWQPCGLNGLNISTITVGNDGYVYAGTTNNVGTSFVFRLSSNCSDGLPIFWDVEYNINSLLCFNRRIYLATWLGIYMSTNSGINWDTIRSYGTQHLAINSKGHLFAADNGGISRTTNDGISWDDVSAGLSSKFITSIIIDLSEFIFVGTRVGGVNRSVDNGDSWSEVNNGLRNTAIDFLFVSRHNSIFADASYWGGSLPPSRVFRSRDGGLSWSFLGSLDSIPMPMAQDRDGNLYGRCSESLYGSSDDGDHWAKLGFDTLSVCQIAVNDSNIFVGAYYPAPYYYNFAGLFRSSDRGNTWQYIGFKDTSISSIAVKPSGEIYLGRINNIFRSTNNGENWISYNFPHPVNTLFINSKGYLFVGSHQYKAPLDSGAIYRSTNDGLSWDLVKTTDYNVMSFVCDSLGKIFAGDVYSGVYQSTDDGETWTSLNTGLINTSVLPLAIDSFGYLYAGTYGDGVFRGSRSLYDDVRENDYEMPSSFALLQNYPNPFNPSTTIIFSLHSRSAATLKVYDVIGREVATLVSEELQAGDYSRLWNAEDLPSGIYFYRLQAGSYTKTKKLVLIR